MTLILFVVNLAAGVFAILAAGMLTWEFSLYLITHEAEKWLVLSLFQALGGVAKERHDLLNTFFQSIKLIERWIALDDLVGKNSR